MKIYPKVLLRVPQLKLNASLYTEWEKLKASIAISSTDFYKQIKDVTAEELDKLPRAVYHTIWKYFNRSQYRATPYGSFAGCGVVEMDTSTEDNEIVVKDSKILHKFPCWTLTDKLALQITVVTADTLVCNNSSCYSVGNQIRFVAREEDSFILAETDGLELFLQVLDSCKVPVAASVLLATIEGCSIAVIQEMVDLQLLLTSNAPNIIGQDYFERLGYVATTDDPLYILAERKVLEAKLTSKTFQDLPELISLMHHFVPDPAFDDLERFKAAFSRKFEQRVVPLMVALDPELGVGYANLDLALGLEAPIAAPPRIEGVNDKRVMVDLLFKSLIDSGCKVIQLEHLNMQPGKVNKVIPGSLGVLGAVVDDLLIIEQIGGPTANRLLGRFSLIGKDIEQMCTAIAAEELAANPGVLFFDIGYTDEVSVDNVNRRKQIYPYQLSLLNYDDSHGALYLADIDVSVIGDQVILYDRNRGKRIVPRLSSGYNYKRSNLAVYRFLNDLQHDGLKTNFSLKLTDYFPDENFYPRLQYKNIVLSPAQWRISTAALQRQAAGTIDIHILADYLKSMGLEKYAVTRTEDRTMVFDLDNQADLNELLHVMSKFDSFILEEGFIANCPLVRDKQGNGYAHQFVLSLVNEQKQYDPIELRDYMPAHTEGFKKIFLPCDEWLYFEIYTHPLRIDPLLDGPIRFLLKEEREKIESWFFVRYDENGTHLRLRLRLKKPSDHLHMIQQLNAVLRSEMISGIVSDVKVCSYKREAERYGEDLMASIEKHFCLDSLYVLEVLASGATEEEKYRLCTDMLMAILDALGDLTGEGMMYVDKVCQAFSEEYQTTGDGFKALNRHFQRMLKSPLPIDDDTLSASFETCKSSAKELQSNCPDDRKVKLMADLIHMHANRMFPSHQRSHEMMVYYFCQKMLLRQKAFEKHAEDSGNKKNLLLQRKTG
ncbi:lantibiotic dehydratase [Chitinophaga filiformis]|uniref:Thiopeptide-type bacteriocin biosynthesis domain-containing protein n=1 Tax=Chitinophaga filiformis TaxID=104663 RepID=A0A1G7MIB8_CHIFI|nr:lantibiotic dehydratase [Chitinophaga filiformis]SDF61461.1 thiopeptide-type bacteriocin biosynthesis domain-containing protein [Chitinophaga filiformis]